MKIIKLGGSLTRNDELQHCLREIDQRNSRQPLIIVPGGGAFADQVRIQQRLWRFNDKTAHDMAILAMQQMALMLHALQPNWPLLTALTETTNDTASIQIWLPQLFQLNHPEIEASWSVTSDSLAAWLANQLQADELVLVKAAPITENKDIFQLQKQGIVDAAFHLFITDARYDITVLNAHQFTCNHC